MTSRKGVEWIARNHHLLRRGSRAITASCRYNFQEVSPRPKIRGRVIIPGKQQEHHRWPRSMSRLLSTHGSSSTEDFSMLSFDELKKTAIRMVRHGSSPHEAQAALEELNRRNSTLEDGGKGEDLSSLQTSVIDAWLKYQTKAMQDIQQKMIVVPLDSANGNSRAAADYKENMRLQEGLLREVHHAATSVTSILETMVKPTLHHFVAILRAWANTCEAAHASGRTKLDIIVGIPQRAQHMLTLQEVPTVESYNQVIKAWAYSTEYLRGTMAEQLFKRIEYPNGESFHLIMRAHAWSKESRSAFQATGHFMRMMRLLEIGREDMEPSSMDEYHVLCEAWTRAGDKNAPSKVATVLEIMNTAYRKNLTNLRPDTRCYRDALVTMSRRHNILEVGDLADETLKAMKNQMLYPDTECYRAAILAWKHVALSRDNADPEHALRRAQDILQEMAEAFHRTTQVTVQPATEDYNNVLHILTLSKSPKAIDHAKKLFKTLHSESDVLGGPDAETYRCMLDIWCCSKYPEKLNNALELLAELKDNLHDKPTMTASPASRLAAVNAFNSFIRVCGASSSSKKDILERRKIVTIALRSMEDMKTFGLLPNSGTYTALVEACDHLLPSSAGQERQQVLENVFQRACDDGLINQSLLEQFKSTASTYLFTKLVVARSVQLEDIKVLPESWTRNVQGFKEGRKVMPLSIHGSFTFTKAAAEYRMRKLRSRTNQRLLQGGRMK